MPNRHFPPLTAEQCNVIEAANRDGGDLAAASALLTLFDGDRRKADCALWGTWEGIVGGEPFKRNEAAVSSDEAQFLMRLVRIVDAGLEVPTVERVARPVAA
ncbi:MAG: hypothetical protein JWP02_3561 [Acidimicrobiales bacterium]|nr:hypothetical protein [Acidimicrobiales bacterium]